MAMLNMDEAVRDEIEQIRRMFDASAIDLRVACPGIVQEVDYDRQVLTVQLAIRERLNKQGDGIFEDVEVPILPDVPFFVYTGGDYCITLPIKPGDDCLVVFGDSCMDAWWQNGGVQNQIERRRHDLSDGFAIVGFRSQPAVVTNYSQNTAQYRNKAGDAYVEIDGNNINIIASGDITINGRNVFIN